MGGKKVCIVTLGSVEKYGDEDYNIFILDLDSGDDSRSRIQISRNFIDDVAFCVFGSTLYAFTGYDPIYKSKGWEPVFKYDLPTSEEFFDLKLDMNMFVEAGRLNHPKLRPTATVLPDGRILVFSTLIEVKSYLPHRCDFEIFDPVSGVCHQLPMLRPNYVAGLDSFDIFSHSIMNKSILVLQTEVGSFTLNLQPPYDKACWGIDSFPCASLLPSHPGRSFVLVGKEICLIPYFAFDICDVKEMEDPFARWYYEFPHLSSIPDDCYPSIDGGITVLEDDVDLHDQIGLCILIVGEKKDTNQPHIFLDVYKLHLEECRKELAMIRGKKLKDGQERELLPLPGATKVKSYEFMLECQIPFAIEDFSFIRAS